MSILYPIHIILDRLFLEQNSKLQNKLKNELKVEASQYTYIFYSGLVLTFLAILPNYSYFITLFSIPYIIGNAFLDFIAYFFGIYGEIIWIISLLTIIFIPMNMVLVIFWEILLIPLELISPLTSVAGTVLLYIAISNYSQI